MRAVENGGLDLFALLQVPVDVLDRHRRIVDQDADRQRQAAERHELMVSPMAERQMIEASTDSGIEMVMISVLRQRAQKQQNHETRSEPRR